MDRDTRREGRQDSEEEKGEKDMVSGIIAKSRRGARSDVELS